MGNPGVGRVKVGPIAELVTLMLDKLLADRPIAKGGRACVIINGMGGTTMMEQLTIWNETPRSACGARDYCHCTNDWQLCHHAGNGRVLHFAAGANR